MLSMSVIGSPRDVVIDSIIESWKTRIVNGETKNLLGTSSFVRYKYKFSFSAFLLLKSFFERRNINLHTGRRGGREIENRSDVHRVEYLNTQTFQSRIPNPFKNISTLASLVPTL